MRSRRPGSRNAPIALTLAAAPGIDAVSVIDERSAGFVALGMAKASGRPVAVTCTSGTAATNLHPAIVEAWEARVPLIVLTADRPPELREVGAGQAIDQIKLYGSSVKWFVELGTHPPGRETAIHHRALGCRAYWTAAGGRPGPVHLNVPLREPLAPQREDLPTEDWMGRPTDARGPRCASTRAPLTRTTSRRSPSGSPRHRAEQSSAGPAPRTSPAQARGSRPRPAGRCSPSPPPAFAAASTTARM